jgi:polynucleotide 5'-kinase involved in rRNA processing
LELNDEWEYAVRYAKNQDPNLGKKAKIVGTGGKGVGKSTMLKYIGSAFLVVWICIIKTFLAFCFD